MGGLVGALTPAPTTTASPTSSGVLSSIYTIGFERQPLPCVMLDHFYCSRTPLVECFKHGCAC